jgi:hypothetical protein
MSRRRELRNREAVLGTTQDSLRVLRIRYIEPRHALATVRSIETDYRDL